MQFGETRFSSSSSNQGRCIRAGVSFSFSSGSLDCFFFYSLFHIHTEPNHGTNGRHHGGQSQLIPNIGAKYSIRSQTLGALSIYLSRLKACGMARRISFSGTRNEGKEGRIWQMVGRGKGAEQAKGDSIQQALLINEGFAKSFDIWYSRFASLG